MPTIILKILKNKYCKIFAFLIVFCSFAFIVYKTLAAQKDGNILWIVLSFLLQLLFSMFLLYTFIPDSVDKNNQNQKASAFLTNLIFMLSTTLFFTTSIYYNKLLFQIITFSTLYILLIFVYVYIKRKNEIDMSCLKITNFFMFILFSGVLYLLKKYCENENIHDIIYFYYFLPLLMLQGLYGLLDKKEENK